jgi:hypothetical protein
MSAGVAAGRATMAAMLVAVAVAAVPAAAETLGDALRARGVAARPKDLHDLGQAITSYGVLDDARAFVIAYYRADGTGALREPLVVRRLDRTSFQWRSAELSRKAIGTDRCLGPATAVRWAGRDLVIGTHITPSAGCTIVLGPELSVQKVLAGWFLAAFPDGSIVYHRSQVHFAPTHSVEIAVWEPRRGRDRTLYPMKPHGRLRLEHMARIATKYADEAWCRTRNHHCDPERFDESLVGDVAVDGVTSALALVVGLDNTAWWTDAERGRLEAFRELRRTLGQAEDSMPADALFRALAADLARAARSPGPELTLAGLEPDVWLRDLVAAALAAARPAGQDPRAFLVALDPRWGEPETWSRLARAIEVPPEVIEVVFVYRNVTNGGTLGLRELSRADLLARCGDEALPRCLEAGALARIFRR